MVVVLLIGEVLIADDVADIQALFLSAAGLLIPVVETLDNAQPAAIIHDASLAI